MLEFCIIHNYILQMISIIYTKFIAFIAISAGFSAKKFDNAV